MVRVLTWNVNGLRSVVAQRGSLVALLDGLCADVVCLQETKLRRTEVELPLAVVPGWEGFFAHSPGGRPGPAYAGVATFVRAAASVSPVAAAVGLTCPLTAPDGAPTEPHPCGDIAAVLGCTPDDALALDSEGRVLVTDHGSFLLVNLYGPAITSEERLEERLMFKLTLYRALELRLRSWLAAGRCVLLAGDFNISPTPLDCCDPGPTQQFLARPDRAWLAALLESNGPGVQDVFRTLHPSRPGAYTCWSTATGARVHNWGTRIDLILAAGKALSSDVAETGQNSDHSPAGAVGDAGGVPLVSLARECDVMQEWQGSDHAPVYVDLALRPRPPPPAGQPLLACAGAALFSGRQASLRNWLMAPSQLTQQQQQQHEQHRSLPHPQDQQADLEVPVEQQQQQQQQQAACHAGSTADAMRQDLRQLTSSRKRKATAAAGQGPESSSKIQLKLSGFFAPVRSGNNGCSSPTASASTATCSTAGNAEQLEAASLVLEQAERPPYHMQPPPQSLLLHQQQQQQQGCHEQPPSWAVQQAPAAAAAWQRLAARMAPPNCSGHGEPCVIRSVKKAGPNQGRQFAVCARPAGPYPVGRCDFFKWETNERRFKST